MLWEHEPFAQCFHGFFEFFQFPIHECFYNSIISFRKQRDSARFTNYELTSDTTRTLIGPKGQKPMFYCTGKLPLPDKTDSITLDP